MRRWAGHSGWRRERSGGCGPTLDGREDTGQGYSQTGVYSDLFLNYYGCDSVRVLQLTVLPNVSSTISQTICAGESFEGYSQTGVYTDQFTAANGCDSVRVLQLSVLPENNFSFTAMICLSFPLQKTT